MTFCLMIKSKNVGKFFLPSGPHASPRSSGAGSGEQRTEGLCIHQGVTPSRDLVGDGQVRKQVPRLQDCGQQPSPPSVAAFKSVERSAASSSSCMWLTKLLGLWGRSGHHGGICRRRWPGRRRVGGGGVAAVGVTAILSHAT
jgi:hypothetical protein